MAQVLRHVPQVEDPRVLIDAATRDDAAVYQLSENRALVASVDFFAPIVDDPYDFGAIAAANAFSDIYAMGASPILALNLVAWPRDPEILALLGDTLKGGFDKAREAGAFVMGGHSIDDKEPKYGMVTIGEVEPSRIVSNAGARPGDALLLTKPLGTGILSTAQKRGLVNDTAMKPAIASMVTLNAGAAAAVRKLGTAVHAATDVTGFGLLGHLRTMMEASGTSAILNSADVPAFDGVKELIQQGAVPGGTRGNLTYAAEVTTFGNGLEEVDQLLLADAQTSGGLLIAIDASGLDGLVLEITAAGAPACAVVGEVTDRKEALLCVDT